MLQQSTYKSLFCFPFFYFIQTRTKTKIKTLSWVLIYLVPLFFLICTSTNSFVEYIIFGLFILGVYNFYEMGYIWNDTETIKNEVNPSLRLNEWQLRFYYDNRIYIYLSKLSIGFIIGLVVYFIEPSIISYYIVNMSLIIILYVIYNNVRSRINLPLHFLLVCSRFVLPIIPFISFNPVWIVFSFPIINLLERASEKRFNFVFFQKFILSNKGTGRFLFYLLMLFFSVFLGAPKNIIILFSYLFLYRLFSFYMYGKKEQ